MSDILIAGDWHGHHQWAKKILDVAFAEKIEKVIQVGDFGVWHGLFGREYLLILSRHLVKLNKKQKIDLYFLPGNHEDYNIIDDWMVDIAPNEDGHREVEPHIFYTGKVNSWQWEDKKFAVVGGAYSIDRKWRKLNESWWPQELLTDSEVEQAVAIGKVDYMFSHDAPTAHPFRNLKNILESELHRRQVNTAALALQPDVWFHGHYHDYAEYEFYHATGTTKVFSLDADGHASYDPSLIKHTAVLDTESGSVYSINKEFNWFSKKFYFDKG